MQWLGCLLLLITGIAVGYFVAGLKVSRSSRILQSTAYDANTTLVDFLPWILLPFFAIGLAYMLGLYWLA